MQAQGSASCRTGYIHTTRVGDTHTKCYFSPIHISHPSWLQFYILKEGQSAQVGMPSSWIRAWREIGSSSLIGTHRSPFINSQISTWRSEIHITVVGGAFFFSCHLPSTPVPDNIPLALPKTTSFETIPTSFQKWPLLLLRRLCHPTLPPRSPE